ncbi:MAG: SPASM domain-containing protein [bacterium]|nr:SPASM domain-containing protein [bacterium]
MYHLGLVANCGLDFKESEVGQLQQVRGAGKRISYQSYFASIGNILNGKWEKIWNAKSADDLRRKAYLMERCKKCQ